MSEWRRLDGELAAWTQGEGPRLVFVHGFTQTSNSWKPIAERFASSGYETIIVDAPGHGDSTAVHANLYEAADLITSQCAEAVYVGYSMGGRLCLHAAAMHPEHVRGLAMIGASPGVADESDRAARRAADDELAEHIERIGVETFLDEWLAQPLFAGLVVDPQQRADRRRNSAEGLASSLRLAGTGVQCSMWPRLGEMTVPILTIAGELDTKFATVCRKIATAVLAGRYEAIDGAGHAAHLQDPDQVVAIVQSWLTDISW